ncbi:MAG: hypothetical protein JRJ14_07630 [Deltaproteobacteria bacterium]|nr:hypothetical protein [Deltaproteobacteria bacterium]
MKWQTVLLFLVFVFLVASVIAAIWTQVIPEYRAEAEVRVRPIIPYLVFRTEDSGMIPLYSSYVNTQVSIMRGSTVLQRVLDQQKVQQTQWYKKPSKSLMQRLLGNPSKSHLERLRAGLSISHREETEIIDISFSDSSTKDARIIVDTVLDRYIQYIGEKSDATKDELYSKLIDQYKSVDNEIKGQEMISAELNRMLGTGTPQELISSERIRLGEMQTRLSEKRQSIAILEWERKELYVKYIGEISNATKDKLYSQLVDQYKSLETEVLGLEKTSAMSVRLDETQARLSELRQNIAVSEWKRKKLEDLMKQAITPDRNDVSVDSTVQMEMKPKYYEDAEWRALDRNFRTIQHGIATSELESNNPEIIQARKDMKFSRELLRLREEQLNEQWRDQLKDASGVPVTTTSSNGLDNKEELKSLEHQLARTKYEEQLLLPELKKQQRRFQELFDSAQLLEKENKALQHKRDLFKAVRQRLDKKNMERNVPGSIEVLTQASVSSEPYKDYRILFTAITLVLGLGLTISGWLLKRKRMV